MTWLNLADINDMVSGRLQGLSCAVSRVCIDSRQVQANDLFVALPGPNFDGHQFVTASVAKGASAVLVSRAVAAHQQQQL